MNLRSLVLCLILLHLTACGGGEEDGNYIPTVLVECSSGAISGCAASPRTVHVGLTDDLALNCDTGVKALNASARRLLFTITGSASSSQSGIYLTASIGSWLNSSGGSQDSLNPGDYKVCAFVDLNGNDQLDSTEPVGSGQISTGQARYILNSWTSAL